MSRASPETFLVKPNSERSALAEALHLYRLTHIGSYQFAGSTGLNPVTRPIVDQ